MPEAYRGPAIAVGVYFVGLFFFRMLINLRRCLSHPDGSASWKLFSELFAFVMAAPFLMTARILVEAQIDPDFVNRSYANPDAFSEASAFMFAL